jgi:hypothetical protein
VPRPSPQTSCVANGLLTPLIAQAVALGRAVPYSRPPWWPTNFPYAGRSGAGGGSLGWGARPRFPTRDDISQIMS